MGAFDRFKNADPMGTRKFITAGNHTLMIKRVQQGLSANPKTQGVEKTVVEFKVLESDSKEHPVGSSCSLVEMSNKEGYDGNVLKFVAGALGETIEAMKGLDEQTFEDFFSRIFGADQLLTNMIVRCSATQTKTTKGGDYTAKEWEAVPARMYEKYGMTAPDGAYTDLEGEG